MIKRILMAALLLANSLLANAPCIADEIAIGRFSVGDLSGWRDQTLRGKEKTSYSLARESGRSVLKAESSKAASGLLKKVSLAPRTHQVLRWTWKIEHTLKNGDEKTKEGDDNAARVYVVFPRGLFWKTKSICYIWANKLSKGSHLANAYTDNVVMIAVESGEEKAGEWVSEKRNVYEDYRNLFGEEPPEIGAIAVMTDTDNTGEKAAAYYGDIFMGSP